MRLSCFVHRALWGWLALLISLSACAPAVETLPTSPPAPTLRPADDRFPDSTVPYPADYHRAGFHHFLTVERPDATIRDLYISPEAVAALAAGGRLPNDTVIIIEGYHALVDAQSAPIIGPDGRYLKGEPFAMIHVAHRRRDWSAADFPAAIRAGDWNFGSFDAQSGARFDEDLAACFNCHQSMPETDFVYSAAHLLRYAQTGETQYLFCNLRRRVPC